MRSLVLAQVLAVLASCSSLLAQDAPLDVISPTLVEERVAAVFDVTAGTFDLTQWTAGPTVTLSLSDEGLVCRGELDDPYFFSPDLEALDIQGDIEIRLTARRTNSGFAQIFTSEQAAPDYAETRATRFSMEEDGELCEYVVPVKTYSPLKTLRIDLGLDAGQSVVAKLVIVQKVYEPLKFGVFTLDDGVLNAELLRDAKKLRDVRFEFPKRRPFEYLDATAVDGADATTRRFYAFHEALADAADKSVWPTLDGVNYVVRFAPDALGAEIVRKADSTRVAVLTPLVADADDIALERVADEVEVVFHKAGSQGALRFAFDNDVLTFAVASPVEVAAPIVRVLGEMRQAVLPGVEYLEQGERSSSTLDVNPDERARYRPAPLWVTAPFAAATTERGAVALVYNDPTAQVEFAVPDFLDADENSSRFNVLAKKLEGKLRFAEPEPVEESILWAIEEIGLPDLPARPRNDAEEDALHIAAFERSALKVADGWVTSIGPGASAENSHYGTDFISTIYELTGKVVDAPRWNVGGAQLRNYSAFFAAGKTWLLRQWLDGEAKNMREKQLPDGSFRYAGKYLRGSDVDYASGDCARYVYRLLDHWRLTGNAESLAAGLKGVDFVNDLKTPRGAQTWELSLHTPDLVASSRCCAANVIAYEATSDARYLEQARRWALSGMAFIYLWQAPSLDSDAVMRYAAIPVFGTTDWIAPCWIGTPVQWCGLDYADAVIELARYDDSLDWIKIAGGIVTCAEQMEYPDGEYIGSLPDSFSIDKQTRNPVNINPCVVHMLRKKLDRVLKR